MVWSTQIRSFSLRSPLHAGVVPQDASPARRMYIPASTGTHESRFLQCDDINVESFEFEVDDGCLPRIIDLLERRYLS